MNIQGDPRVEVKRVFPYGAQAATENPNQPDFKIVDVQVKQAADGEWIMGGWAYPNKMMTFELADATETPRGWIVYKGSVRYLLTPLSQQVGQALYAEIEAI
jgi:hypothetical protein